MRLTVFLVNNYQLSIDLKISRTYSEGMTATTHCIKENREVTNYNSGFNYCMSSTATLSPLLVPSEFKELMVNKIIDLLLLFSASMACDIIAKKVAHDSRRDLFV